MSTYGAVALQRLVDLREEFEDVVELFGGDANTRIPDSNRHCFAPSCNTERNAAAAVHPATSMGVDAPNAPAQIGRTYVDQPLVNLESELATRQRER